jgi:hypothetical protein
MIPNIQVLILNWDWMESLIWSLELGLVFFRIQSSANFESARTIIINEMRF